MAVFLQEGHLVEIDYEKANGEVMKFKSLVENVTSDELLSVYAPMYKGTTYPLNVDDALKIFYSVLNRSTGKYDIYSFNAQVISRIRKDNIAMLRIKKVTEVIQVQRRDTYRLSFVKKMAITMEVGESEKTIEILSKDISVGGIRGIVSQSLTVGQEIVCHLFLSDSEHYDIYGFVLSSGLVEDSRLKYEVRIQFHKVNPDILKKMVNFINKAQADMIKRLSSSKHDQLMRQALGETTSYPDSKREKNDCIFSWVNYAPFFLWVIFAGSLLVFMSGMPATEYPLQRFFNFIYRRGWNYTLLQNSLYMMFGTLVLSAISIYLNQLRLKRNYDYYRSTYFVLTTLSIVMIIVIASIIVTTQG